MNTNMIYQSFQTSTEYSKETKIIVPFLVFTFGLTWGLAALLLLFYDQLVAIFGEINITNPLYILFSELYQEKRMDISPSFLSVTGRKPAGK